jgi:hypothetical protein
VITAPSSTFIAFNELPLDVRQFIEQEFFNYADNIVAIARERSWFGFFRGRTRIFDVAGMRMEPP